MANRKSTMEVIPSAKRLIRSLRDVGYDFKHAVADLIDNSIAAGASTIAIKMRFDAEDSWLRVADDGAGMDGSTITEAMRFGTERDYEADELGKFGLGLKTASLSQCSRLTVASRVDRETRRIEVRQWDLEHVDSTNRWEIIDVPAAERPEALVQPLLSGTGTVVLWELMDRVLGYRIPWGERAKTGFLRIAEELDLHLGMVFHRFLSGEARRKKKVKITINETVVEPWDPYARDEKATICLPRREFEVRGDLGPGLVAYTPFILPSQEQFSSLRAFNRYAGPSKWNYQQGFYIYRADRLIQSGGWSYMRTSDEHTKLARIAIDFRPDLDSAFDLNVAKARVNLPSDLKLALKTHIEQVVKQAKKVYSVPSRYELSGADRGQNRTGEPSLIIESTGADSRPESPQDGRGSAGPHGFDGIGHGYVGIGVALDRAARNAGESRALKKIRKALRREDPEIATQIGW